MYINSQNKGVYTSLLPNTDYEIRLTYRYNLNDGKENITVINTYKVKTLKQVPNVNLETLSIKDNEVQFNILVTDPNIVGEILSIELLQNNQLVNTLLDKTNRSFTDLLSNTLYTIRVTYQYDLDDGLGNRTIVKTINFKTLKTLPKIIVSTNTDTSEVDYTVTVIDKDSTGSLSSVALYKDAILKETKTDLTGSFTNLLSNNSYQLVVTYNYDINDGLGEKTLTKEVTIHTTPLTEPLVELITNATNTMISYDISVDDDYNIYTLQSVKLYLGTELRENVTDFTKKIFNDLINNVIYRLEIKYTYDLNDGLGIITKYINKEILTGKAAPEISLNQSKVTSDEILVNIVVNDINNIGHLDKIELYRDDLLINTLTDVERTFTGLLSNTLYKVIATYSYDLDDGLGTKQVVKELEIKTLKEIPVITINKTSTKDTINYEILVIDQDQAGEISKVLLYQNDNLVNEQTDLNNKTFINLLSNTEYKIQVQYTYNLNDGKEQQILIKETTIQTKALIVPIVELMLNVNRHEISYEYDITDIDNILEITNVKLYKDSNLIKTNDVNQKVFNELIANNNYQIVVNYTYDLHDGKGINSEEVTYNVRTLKQIPTITISPSVITHESIDFIIVMSDPNVTSSITKIELYYGETLIEGLNDVLTRHFDNLMSNTDYTIKASYIFDLNDGLGMQKAEQVYNFNTFKQAPNVILSTSSTKESITYHVNLNDPDTAGSIKEVRLIKNNLVIKTSDKLNDTFTNLLSNNSYQLEVVYNYDINDGNGVKEKSSYETINTIAKELPIIDLSINKTDVSVNYQIALDDKDHVSSYKNVKLYDLNDILLNNITDINISTFSELQTNTEYKLVVEYDYDLNDGLGSQTIKKEVVFKTLKTKPKVEILPFTISQTNINFIVNTTDFGTGCEVTTIGLYKDKTLIQRLVDLSIKEFYELTPYTDYEIRVTYTYDLSDGSGLIGDTVIYNFNTLKNNPLINYGIVNATKSAIDFTVIIDDYHESGYVKAFNLYYQDQVVKTITPTDTLPQMDGQFLNLYSNSMYKLGVVYEYDLADKEGVRTKEEYYYINTLTKETPMVDIINVNPTYSQLSFGLSTTDNDLVGITYKSIKLLDGTDIVNEFTVSDLTCKNLLSNHQYQIEVTYTYDLFDNTGVHERIAQYDLITNGYMIPDIELVNTNIRFNIIEFEVSTKDTFELFKKVTVSNLYLNNNLVSTLNTQTKYTYDNLYTGSTYDLEIKYVYDLRDGNGEQTTTYMTSIKTPNKEIPTIAIVNANSTEHSVTWDYEITDIDKVGSIKTVKLNNSLLDTTSKEQTNLNSGKKYILSVTYEYDLGDGQGTRSITVTKNLVTQVEPITVTNFEILNTKAVQIGQEVHVRISFDNPSNLVVDAFYVNGIETTVTSQVDDYAIMKFTPLEIGDYEVKLSAIKYTLLEEQLSIDITSVYTDYISVLGNMKFIDCYFEKDYTTSLTNWVIIEVDNPHGYDIKSVKYKPYHTYNHDLEEVEKEVIKIDNNHFKYEVTESSSPFNAVCIYHNLKYFIFGTNTLEAIISLERYIYGLYIEDPTIYEVSTAEELQTMTEMKIYSLQNDIDLKGFTWNPYDFNGVLLGNGYSIKNLTIVEETSNGNRYLSLFNGISGYVENTHLANLYISSKVNGGDVRISGFGQGTGDESKFRNCSVSGYMYGETDKNYLLSGFIFSGGGSFENCFVDISINAIGDNGSVYGFSSYTKYMKNCYVNLDLTANKSVAVYSEFNGLCNSSSKIINCYVTGKMIIKGPANKCSGLIGQNNGEIINSYTDLEIESEGDVSGFVYSNNGFIDECYSKTNMLLSGGGVSFVLENMGTISSSYADCKIINVIKTFNYIVTGFCRTNSGVIKDCYVTGEISSSAMSDFVSSNNTNGIISNCYSALIVEKYNNIGFSSQNYGSIISCFTVSNSIENLDNREYANMNNNMNTGTIENCYSIEDKISLCPNSISLATTEAIIKEIKKVWDLTIWDFTNLNDLGCPTLLNVVKSKNE